MCYNVYVLSNGLADTDAIAQELASTFMRGSVVFLIGELGAGKTAFAKGVALELGVRETVVSPTFTLARAYNSGTLPLLHIDAYRLWSAGITGESLLNELEVTGLYEGLEDGVVLLEWCESFANAFPKRIEVSLKKMQDNENMREIEVVRYD